MDQNRFPYTDLYLVEKIHREQGEKVNTKSGEPFRERVLSTTVSKGENRPEVNASLKWEPKTFL